jgi:hypothetical protein
METTIIEAEPLAPTTGVTKETTPELGAVMAPKVRVEMCVDSHPGTSMDVVVREPEIEEAAPIRLAPMAEAMSTSRGGLELLDDNLVDPSIVTRNMESMRHAEKWIKVCCGYLE